MDKIFYVTTLEQQAIDMAKRGVRHSFHTEKALEIFYSTEVAGKLEDLDTGYYLEDARYIYEIVKEELNTDNL